jgi:predicted metalloendopeptidase
MVQNIRLQFKSILSHVSWMDVLSKNTAQEKVDSSIVKYFFPYRWCLHIKFKNVSKVDRMDVKMGYPDYTYNDTYMNNLYK